MQPAFATHFEPSAASAALFAWYRANRRSYPWRERFAATADPYVVWVSEIMLQQTVIKAVLPVYERFLSQYPDVYSLAAASEDDVRLAVRGLGYYRRFGMLHRAAKLLATQRPIQWPSTALAWKELPGIGDYTAAAIASIAFGDPVAVLDGNVERVIARLTDCRAPAGQPAFKRIFRDLAQELIVHSAPGDSNQALMELGQTICTPSNPRCEHCPIAHGCLARQRGSTALSPGPKIRRAVEEVELQLHIVRDGRGQIGLIERPQAAHFLKGAVGFPTVFGRHGEAMLIDGVSLNCPQAGINHGTIRHTITHHRIIAGVIESGVEVWPVGLTWRWVTPSKIDASLVANLDRKAWHLWSRATGIIGEPKKKPR